MGTNFRSLVSGGFYSKSPTDKTLPVSIRFNNPGAINTAPWLREMPGYVSANVTTAGNATAIFEAPEYGVAAWYELLKRYRAANATTVAEIITKYGGGQDYSKYADFVDHHTGLEPEYVIRLTGDDANLLAFAKAMFHYEAGKPTPLSDEQIRYGFSLARGVVPTTRTNWLADAIRRVIAGLIALFGRKPAAPPPVQSGLAARIVRAMKAKGYRVDNKLGEVNIVYIEGMGPTGTKNDDAPNKFNDARFVIQFKNNQPYIAGSWEATTEPGFYWTANRMNPKGAARIAFGQYHAWQVGMHRGDHEALVQTGGMVTVHRDNNEDMIRTNDKKDTGYFGINQHWGYDLPRDDIGHASAGCLVGRTREGHRAFMKLVKTDPRYLKNKRYTFTSTVLPAEWLV